MRRREQLRELVAVQRALRDVDRQLAYALMLAGAVVATDALARLNVRVKVAAQRKPEGTKRMVAAAVRDQQVTAAVTAAVGLDAEEFLDTAFRTLEAQSVEEFRRATLKKLRIIRQAAKRLQVPDEEIPTLVTDEERSSHAAGVWRERLRQFVLAAAAGTVLAEYRAGQQRGEVSDRLLPVGIVREVVQLNGGLPESGELLAGLASSAGIPVTVGSTWVYGFYGQPKTSFEPHLALDGIEVGGLDDPQLLNGNDWPDVPFYAPGDHYGCQCELVPIVGGF